MSTTTPVLSLAESVRRVARARAVILREWRQVLVGQEHLAEQLLVAIFAGGHCLLTGPTGSGRAAAIRTMARLLHLSLSHVHCHPELSSEDILGREIFVTESPREPTRREFRRGPIFSNILFADEFDRANHRAQESLLQPLFENRVSVAGACYELTAPFSLVASRNTHERQSTFPVSDAVSDRFLVCIPTSEPDRDIECQVAGGSPTAFDKAQPVLRARDVLWIQKLAHEITVSQHLIDYAVDLVRLTRPGKPTTPPQVQAWLQRGASTRAAQAIVVAAKVRAMIHGRSVVHSADVRAVLPDTLRHRVQWRADAEYRGIVIEHLVEVLIQAVPLDFGDEPLEAPMELQVLDRGEKLPPRVDDSPQGGDHHANISRMT